VGVLKEITPIPALSHKRGGRKWFLLPLHQGVSGRTAANLSILTIFQRADFAHQKVPERYVINLASLRLFMRPADDLATGVEAVLVGSPTR